MATGEYIRKVLVDNDQIVAVYLSLEDVQVPNYDEILIHHTTDISTYDTNVTNAATQVELVLTHVKYSFSDASNTTNGEVNLAYETNDGSADARVFMTLPAQTGDFGINKGLGKNVLTSTTADFTGNIVWSTQNKEMSGFAIFTFYKKSGFLNNHPKYRKATQANPYPNS